jgi:hypothetical protein
VNKSKSVALYSCAALLLTIFVVIANGIPPQETHSPENATAGPGYDIRASSVTKKKISDGTQAYDVTYSYQFSGRNRIYIKGIGDSPAKGTFSYMAFSPQLEFRDSADGPVLAKLDLKETARAMGEDSTELPQEGDYPDTLRSATWSGPSAFSSVAINVIQKYFPLGYAVRNKNSVDYYVTTFRGLQIADASVRSQIALIVSQPYDKTTGQFSYHVQFVARDKPRLSSTYRYGDDRSQQTLHAAAGFVDQVMAEINQTRVANP